MVLHSKGLGRGLDALFQGGLAKEEPSSETPFTFVPPDSLAPNPAQPRSVFAEEKLDELACSIKNQGIIQPLIVRPVGDQGTYEIIAGERRWRAAVKAGLDKVPVLIKELNDNEAMVAALIENIQREDLNPVEQARGLLAIKNTLGISQEELADRLGMARGTVSNTLRLLNLNAEGLDDLANGRFSAGHARCILALPPGEVADSLRARIISHGLTVREAEEALDYWRRENHFPWDEGGEDPVEGKKKPSQQENSDILLLAKQIGAALNCRTKIRGNSEKGRISLTYESNAQLYDLLEKLGLTLTNL